jgi:hypothetical protein
MMQQGEERRQVVQGNAHDGSGLGTRRETEDATGRRHTVYPIAQQGQSVQFGIALMRVLRVGWAILRAVWQG